MKLVVGIDVKIIIHGYEVRTVKNNEEAGPNDREWNEGNQR